MLRLASGLELGSAALALSTPDPAMAVATSALTVRCLILMAPTSRESYNPQQCARALAGYRRLPAVEVAMKVFGYRFHDSPQRADVLWARDKVGRRDHKMARLCVGRSSDAIRRCNY
jgi:hypothetical protein